MEKRKFKASYSHDLEKHSKEKDSYTFIIPNSNLEDVHISISKKQNPKKEKKTQS